MAAENVGAVAFEQGDLRVRQHEDRGVSLALQARETLVPPLELMAHPDAADARPAHRGPMEKQLVRHPLGAMRGPLQGVGENLALDVRADTIRGRAARPAPLLDQAGHVAR